MSCRFAGVNSPAALWNVIRERRDLLTAPSVDLELPIAHRNLFNRRYPSRIGQLGELYAYVPSMHNLPRQMNNGENQDLYFATQLAFDALADASLRPHQKDMVRGSVRIGYAPPFNSSSVNWLQHTTVIEQMIGVLRKLNKAAPEEWIDDKRQALLESLPPPNASSFLVGTGYRFASWIARECSFSGTALTMDAGMITGAAVLSDAIADLQSGKADVALVGVLTPPFSRAYLEGLAGEVEFSERGKLQPFAQDPDGTLPGEGGAFFVLKRRNDALQARDRIYALVKSTAIGHNRDDDPAAVITEATERAGVPVRTIGMIEADGSGIRGMEARELAAIQRLWGEHRPGTPLVGVGSVKGNIGHTLRSSMAAGIVKAALALKAKVLPPQLTAEHPADIVTNLSSSVYLLTEERPWITGDSASPRRAAVLGANFDPVNPIGDTSSVGRAAVVVLEEEPEVRE